MLIRSAIDKDRDAVIALWRLCDLIASYNNPDADFALALRGDNSTVLVAVSDSGAIRGTTMVGHDGHRGWLYYVASHPDLRATGVGRQLIDAAESWLRERGIRKVQLMVRQTNTQVVGFYERLGYEETPRVLMAKWLDAGD